MDEDRAARVYKCTVCHEAVDLCAVCRLPLLLPQVIRCRGEGGHDHATCATSRRRIIPPRETPSIPSAEQAEATAESVNPPSRRRRRS